MLRASAPSTPLRKTNSRSSELAGLVEAVFLDLVEQRLVADAEDLGRRLAVPSRVLQHSRDERALGLAGGLARHVLQREVPGVGGRGGDGRRRRRGRRRGAVAVGPVAPVAPVAVVMG